MENLMPHTSALKMPESYIDGQATTIQKKPQKGNSLSEILCFYDTTKSFPQLRNSNRNAELI